MATRGRPFEPGNKMGRGRPKGSRNKITTDGKKILREYCGPLMQKALVLVKRGDDRMLSFLLKLGYEPSPTPFKFGKMPMLTLDDLMKASEIVMEYWSAGEISAQEAKAAHEVIEERRKLIETHVLAKGFNELEEKFKDRPPEDKAA